MSSFAQRALRASLLHADTYEEVEADRSSIRQASLIVFAACAAAGAGRWLAGTRAEMATDQVLFQVLLSVLVILVLWIGGSAFSYMVGATFLRGPETETDFTELLRTTGFAFTPGLLRLFVFVPPPALGLGIDLVAFLWVLLAGVVAVRQALDFTTARAVGTFGVAGLLLWLILWGLSVAPLPF